MLDGYARADYLDQAFGYDNSDFLDDLEELGFYIANCSRRNYAQTILSVASSLNMVYLDEIQAQVGSDSQDKTPLTRLIRWSEVRLVLEEQGYQTVAFATGYRPTELEQADYYFRPSIREFSVMERLVMDTSGLVILHDLLPWMGYSDIFPGYLAHRKMIEHTFDQVHAIPDVSDRKFVFVHIIVPHPPFVFGPEGDHGPGSTLNWASPDTSSINERVAILNALYLPGVDSTALYAEMSPVNTFHTELPILPDESFFSDMDSSYDFMLVP
jgi:hypothetical protein